MNDDFTHVMFLMFAFSLLLSDSMTVSVSILVVSLLSSQISVARVAVVTSIRQSLVALFLDTLCLAVLEVRASAEHPRDADESEVEKYDLNERLSSVKLLRSINLFAGKSNSIRFFEC